ncbi:tRNA (adenosine(37)-N6)-threonylcarbamoyltransferase complex ATPase subunit type 1 TsaE [Candidatus Omnitrophota bacterium]
MKYTTNCPEETFNLGCKLGRSLKAGAVVALIGELGTGKTLFTKGIAKAIGVKNHAYVNSPSFVIVKEYGSKTAPLYHFDLYRLKSSHDLETVGYEEYFYSKGISVVEWADRAPDALPDKYITVKFKYRGKNKREIKIDKK